MVLIGAVVLVVLATVVFVLFIRNEDVPPPQPESPTRHLEERKAAIYENLRDLQFEYRVGKLSDADYQTTKLSLQKELAVVLAEIDKISTQKPQAVKPKPAVAANICPHCKASFPKAMKFCGECGKAMS